jgi:hypothetical protein
VDKEIVQQELSPGHYRRWTVTKMIKRLHLSDTARVIIWRNGEFPVVLNLGDLFDCDRQPIQLEIHCIFKLTSGDLLYSYLESIVLPLDSIAKRISERISIPVSQWVASLQAGDLYEHQERLSERSDQAKLLVQSALAETPFEIVRITNLHLFSPALDELYKEFGEFAKDNISAQTEIERNKVRGALRQAVLAGKLEEMHDQSQYENAVRVIEQQKALKEKAMRQELAQAEFAELQEKLQLWKQQQELLLGALRLSGDGKQSSIEGWRRVAEELQRTAVDAPDSPFSPQERQQIGSLLKTFQNRPVTPEEIISAIAKGTDIPQVLFDPWARLQGPHTLRVGDGWKIFDGEKLWQIRLTGIATRRHGFLWSRESPSQAHFEMRVSPENRRFQQDVSLEDRFLLEMGPASIPFEYIGGTPSQISVRVSRRQS